MLGVAVAGDKVAAAAVAVACIAARELVLRRHPERRGPPGPRRRPGAAMAVGIDVDRHFAIAWALAGALSGAGGRALDVDLRRRVQRGAGRAQGVPHRHHRRPRQHRRHHRRRPRGGGARERGRGLRGSAASAGGFSTIAPPTWSSSPCSSSGRRGCSAGRRWSACSVASPAISAAAARRGAGVPAPLPRAWLRAIRGIDAVEAPEQAGPDERAPAAARPGGRRDARVGAGR